MADLSSQLEALAMRGEVRGAAEVLRRASADASPLPRARPRKRLVRPIVVLVVLAAATAVTLVAALPRRDRGGQPVGTAASTSAQALHEGATGSALVWADQTGQDPGQTTFVLGDPATGSSRPLGGPGDLCVCGIVRQGASLFVAAPDGIYRLDPPGYHATRIADGDIVFAAPEPGEVFVAAGSASAPNGATVRLITSAGARAAGPWTVPAGYWLTSPPRATSAGLIVESPPNGTEETFAIWQPATGAVGRVLGIGSQVIDTTTSGARSVVAWTRGDCGREACDLVVSDLGTGQSREIAAPGDDVGFIGGGAFSPDGTKLAAFAVLNRGFVGGPGQGRRMQLVIVDVASGMVDTIAGSVGEFGEDRGFSTWAPSGRWVFFGGVEGPGEDLSGQHVGAHRLGSNDAVELPVPANYTVVAVNPPPAATG